MRRSTSGCNTSDPTVEIVAVCASLDVSFRPGSSHLRDSEASGWSVPKGDGQSSIKQPFNVIRISARAEAPLLTGSLHPRVDRRSPGHLITSSALSKIDWG